MTNPRTGRVAGFVSPPITRPRASNYPREHDTQGGGPITGCAGGVGLPAGQGAQTGWHGRCEGSPVANG
jgi:hypothetical protein